MVSEAWNYDFGGLKLWFGGLKLWFRRPQIMISEAWNYDFGCLDFNSECWKL